MHRILKTIVIVFFMQYTIATIVNTLDSKILSSSGGFGGGSIGLSTGINGGPFIKYEAPDDCRFVIHENQDVSLACNLRTVNSEFDTTNFSVIPSEHTVSLYILCNDTIMAKSALETRSFAHITRLKELSLEYCKITRLTKDALDGLDELRNLTIRTHNINWPALSLDIEYEAFSMTKNIQRLDLSLNNIWSLPENVFCQLNGLSWLNVSWNRLQDITELGFREKIKSTSVGNTENQNNNTLLTSTTSTEATTATKTIKTILTNVTTSSNSNTTTCVLDIELLDISHNHFVLLPANGFGTLKRLRHLRIHENEISMVDDRALGGLRSLQILDLSSNKVVALPTDLFRDPANSIQEIYLQNNSISVLSPKLFTNLEQLQALDLSMNKITSTWIDRTTFSGLIRLVLLNLSNNQITKLEPEIFSDLYTLQILNLRYNQLETIAADTFSPMNNLHTLMLSHNKIKYLDAYSLNGLYVLSLLALDNNHLTGIHPEAFRNCSSLQDLNLCSNELSTVPLALKDMRLLRTVDLGENHISTLNDQGFRGMTNLYGLRLIGNYLTNITKTVFKDLPSLQILNLAHNKIEYVEPGAFEQTASIQAIRLDGNLLSEINNLFAQMPSLLWLNISDNQLNKFDYSDVPIGLLWLDLHKNELNELGNKFGLDGQMRLQTLDASFNHLKRIHSGTVPNSVELLFLNDNLITVIEPHSFMNKVNLTRVDLYANQITSLDVKALRLLPIMDERFLPEFYIGGNPFVCDCNIDWLQKINQVTSRQYPRIMDLDTIYCKLLYNRDRSYISLIEAEPVHFLCSYKTHCFALCHCCEFDACDCEMTCPQNCTCFHDQSWSTNVVECSAGGYTEMPSNIPMDTTELYIDGNELGELSGHSFIGRKNLKVLYANNSNIQIIYNTTFHGLRRLTNLHLENNQIQRFLGHELGALDNLRELYLQNNRISFIDNRTFLELRKLEVLRLDNNKLINFEVWQLAFNPYLVEIGFADNHWSCECEYVTRLQNYLHTNVDKIFDINRIACVYNNKTNLLKDKNGSKCTIKDGVSTLVLQTEDIENLLPFLLATTCAFVGFFGVIFGTICYRHELKHWAHQNCWPIICYKSHGDGSSSNGSGGNIRRGVGSSIVSAFHQNGHDDYDKDRLYDAYITYSLQDEHFVNQILANTLENNIGYRLCLHYRDFSINTYVADTIVEAVECSKRSVIVLSRNFLYNEWSRFEFKSAINEIVKRRRKLVFILYGDLPQRDIDADMRLLLRNSCCLEWDDKKFWQKLRIALPQLKRMGGGVGGGGVVVSGVSGGGTVGGLGGIRGNGSAKRSTVNIYATAQHYNTVGRIGGGGGVVPMGGIVDYAGRRLDCNNYATINDCGVNIGIDGGGNIRNCDKYDSFGCKFGTTNERLQRHHQQKYPITVKSATLDNNKLQHQQQNQQTKYQQYLNHEYAVPTNCLKDSFQNFNGSCEGIGGGVGGGGNIQTSVGDTFECTIPSNKFTLTRNVGECGGGGIGGGSSCGSSISSSSDSCGRHSSDNIGSGFNGDAIISGKIVSTNGSDGGVSGVGGGGGVTSGVAKVTGTGASNNLYNFNSSHNSQNCNCNNSKCTSGDECCNSTLNCTSSGAGSIVSGSGGTGNNGIGGGGNNNSEMNCIDNNKRLPQAMWA